MTNKSNLLDLIHAYAKAYHKAQDLQSQPEDDKAAAEALSAVEAAIGWLDISTAPHDGSMILLGRSENTEDDSGPISTAGRWQEGWEDSIDDMGCDDGFVDVDYQQFSPPRSFGAELHRSIGCQPTHWRPLPEAPTV